MFQQLGSPFERNHHRLGGFAQHELTSTHSLGVDHPYRNYVTRHKVSLRFGPRRNQKHGAIRSRESQTDGVGNRTLILLMIPSLMIKSEKQKNKPMTMFDSGPCDWLVPPLLLPTPTNLVFIGS